MKPKTTGPELPPSGAKKEIMSGKGACSNLKNPVTKMSEPWLKLG